MNFIAYLEQIQPNGDVLLIKKTYDIGIQSEYERENLPNGDIILKIREETVISDPQDLSDHNFTKSNIMSCNFPKRSYKGILYLIYSRINDGMTIILSSSTPRRIKTIEKNDQGFKWFPDLGISIQGDNANNIIKEILTQCVANDIELSMKITLESGIRVHILFS
jgi:hypothetical protein